MDEDADLFRPPWEEDDGPLPSGRAARASEAALLIPLARAQDAVAWLEASVAAAPDDVAGGLRTRLALFEAAGFLAHQGLAVHPHDLALRDAHLTGSPRSSNHACSEPSICTSSPTQSGRRRG